MAMTYISNTKIQLYRIHLAFAKSIFMVPYRHIEPLGLACPPAKVSYGGQAGKVYAGKIKSKTLFIVRKGGLIYQE